MTTEPDQRFGRLIERADGDDFPYYDGRPIGIAPWKWVVIIGAAAAGFAALSLIPVGSQAALLGSRALFVAIPLATFIALTGRSWRLIWRPLHWRDLATMIVFWLLTMALSALAALVVADGDFSHLTANAATDDVTSPSALVLFYLGTCLQLFGEELFTVLPFLAVLALLHRKAHASRRKAVIIAWIVSAVWFGAAHLPTNDWNVAQALVVIGAARIALTLAYIRTKNIAVSFGAHLLNDWVIFTFLLVAAAPRG